jgi:hypothetical protein
VGDASLDDLHLNQGRSRNAVDSGEPVPPHNPIFKLLNALDHLRRTAGPRRV